MSTATPILVIMLATSIAPAPGPRADDPPPLDRETAAARLDEARTIASTEPGQAAKLLEGVAARAPGARTRALARFNLGVLELREGRHDAAREAFEAAARIAPDAAMRRDALYNLAHAHSADTPTPESTPDELERVEKQLEGLRHAEDNFLAAARLDPEYMPAARNLERVRRMIRELESRREQLQQQQQNAGENPEGEQQDGGEGDQTQPTDAAERLQRLADQQREQGQRNAQSPPSSQREQERRADDQKQLSDETEELAERMGEQDRERIEHAQQAQQRAQEALESGDAGAAAEHQRQAADALDRAAQEKRREQSEGQEQQQRAADAEPKEMGESIDPIARDLLEREERQRRSRRQYRPGGRPVEVEEDW